MALNANNAPNTGGGKDFPKMEAGTYPARVVVVADVGLQAQRAYKGEPKDPKYEVSLTYEFVDEFMKDDDGNDLEDKPRWLTETFPFYGLQAEKARSTERYNALDPTGVLDGDFLGLVDTPCMVTVVLNPGKGKNAGRVFENIANVSAMRGKDAARCAPLVNEPVAFDLDSPNMEHFNLIPMWMRKKIASNLEYEGSKLQTLLSDEGQPPKAEPVEEVLDDEVPF